MGCGDSKSKDLEVKPNTSIKTRKVDGTTVTCNCGKTCITFKDKKPIWRADCCCGDCYQKVDWVKSKGWPCELPKGPLDTYYIQNSICHIKGEENLKPF